MSKKVQEQNFIVSEEEALDYIGFEKEKKTMPKGIKKAIIISSIVVASLLVVTTAWYGISYNWRTGKKPVPSFLVNIGAFQGPSFRYYDGITVNGVDISGMSKSKAAKAIDKAQNDKRESYNITFISGNKTYTLNGKNLAFDVDSKKALEEAKEYCISIMKGKTEKAPKNFNADILIDKKKMSVTLENMKQMLHCDPIDATFEGLGPNGLVFVDHIDGIDVDDNSLADDIEMFIHTGATTGEITVTPAKTTPAKIKVESLKAKIQLIGTHTTTAGNTTNSNKNMKKAMEMCNGSVIAPGETWSFNARTGNSNLPSGGWVSSTVIIGGEYVQGYGGGICQASTTIYNAALYANMKIISRYNHAYPSSYAKVGLDATIDYPGKDLKLQNTSEYPMYMQCVMEGKKLTVNIYGCPDDSFDKITLTSYTTERVEGSHYRVAAQRHYWKNGEIFKTESLPSSRYTIKVEKPADPPAEEPDTPDTPDTPSEPDNPPAPPEDDDEGDTESQNSLF